MNQDAERRRRWALDQIAQHERVIADLRSFIEYLEASEISMAPTAQLAGVLMEEAASAVGIGTHDQDEAYERQNRNRLWRLADYIEEALRHMGGSVPARQVATAVTHMGYRPPEGKSSAYDRITSELYRLSKEGRIRRVGRGRFSLAG